ncbi:unnamed protein product [Urochloa humidicola]
MAAAARRIPNAPAAAQPVFPDEILEEIFLRLDAAADLARASAACSSFHRVVSARRFLRRFRSIHPPPILGMLDGDLADDWFVPTEPPHSSASAARVLARAADFTFSFLPDARCWWPRDCCDGRVLLSQRVAGAISSDFLVVCDPLHRRYVMIPPIPDHLKAPIPAAMKNFESFLAPAGEDEEEESSFRVFCTMRFEDNFMTFFSSANKWGLVTNHSSSYFGYRRFYVHGCFFWKEYAERYVLMLDTREMKFSTIDLPPKSAVLNRTAIVDAGEGRLGLLTVGDGTIDLSCKIVWRSNGAGAEGWQPYKMIPLPKISDGFNYCWCIMDIEGRYISLMTLRSHCNDQKYFVLDLNTMLLERLCVPNRTVGPAHLYVSFPPPFSPPSL